MNQVIQHGDRDRYFLDTEFMDDGYTIELISIGIVSDSERIYYAANSEARLQRANDWVKQNVIPQLPLVGDAAWKTRSEIADDIQRFAPPTSRPEFWAYYADYDWIVFCQLFGTMLSLPRGYPQYCMDLKQYSVMLGNPVHPKQEGGEHNALEDARWNKRLYYFLRAQSSRLGSEQ